MSTFVNKQRAAGGSTFFNNLRPAARLFGTCSIMIGGCWVRRPLAGLRSSFGVQPAAASQHAGFMFFHYPEHRPRAAPSFFFMAVNLFIFSPAGSRKGGPPRHLRKGTRRPPAAGGSLSKLCESRAQNPARGAVLIFAISPFYPPLPRAHARGLFSRDFSLFALCSLFVRARTRARTVPETLSSMPLSRRFPADLHTVSKRRSMTQKREAQAGRPALRFRLDP